MCEAPDRTPTASDIETEQVVTRSVVNQLDASTREAIRDLVARYNANGDSGRLTDVMALFVADAVMEIDLGTGAEPERHEGLAAIEGVFRGAVVGDVAPTHVRHFTATQQIDLIDEVSATSRCYFQVLTQVGLDHWGRYVDRFVRTDEGWRFAQRRVTVDGYADDSLFRRPD